MTKKDYQLIAGRIKILKSDYDKRQQPDKSDAMVDFAYLLSLKLERENERFDRERFLVACGVKK